ncbi:hypothetical protein LPJ73_002037 [Coemansia sp. RSA 2703]|nr:hypothetical protein LPJ73_002037 [Coemansia sp. RSA 2703]KAJ2379350.1 hypothetical protein IW150_000230 [Coemansia sp. RSA 2607]KAJ2398338.1 hypothetical protein GGI05_000146 [Coemansia sp. RSA 2603]
MYRGIKAFNTVVNIIVLACYSVMLTYSGRELPRGQSTINMVNESFTLIISVLITLLSLPLKSAVGKYRFPQFKHAREGMKQFAIWYVCVGVFIITDPVFQHSRRRMGKQAGGMGISVFRLMAATAVFVLLAFLLNTWGFFRSNPDKKVSKTGKGNESAISVPQPTSKPAAPATMKMPMPSVPPAPVVTTAPPMANAPITMPMPMPKVSA